MIKSSKATFEAEAVLVNAKADCLFAVLFFLFGDVDGRREGRGKGEDMTHPGDGWTVIPGGLVPGVCVGATGTYSKLQEVWTCAAYRIGDERTERT